MTIADILNRARLLIAAIRTVNPRTVALVAAAAMVAVVAAFSPARADFPSAGETPMIGATDPNLQSNIYSCPSGMFLVGVSLSEGGWLAHIVLLCTPVNQYGFWVSRLMAPMVQGPSIGGSGGNHWANALSCGPNRYINSITGFVAKVHYTTITDLTGHWELFVADPKFGCVGKGGYNETPPTLADTQFESEHPDLLNPTTWVNTTSYMNATTYRCPRGSAATGMRIAEKPSNGDIEALGLFCSVIPSQAPPDVVAAEESRASQLQSPGVNPSAESRAATETTRTFRPPYYSANNQLAFCQLPDNPSTCGKPVANAFCVKNGFHSAGQLRASRNRGTFTTIDGLICNNCQAFDFVTCSN